MYSEQWGGINRGSRAGKTTPVAVLCTLAFWVDNRMD